MGKCGVECEPVVPTVSLPHGHTPLCIRPAAARASSAHTPMRWHCHHRVPQGRKLRRESLGALAGGK